MFSARRRGLLVGLAAAACGCAPWMQEVGGTPGPPAIDCASAADGVACQTALAALETVRGNIGGFCGTPDMQAAEDVFRLGAAAAPYLAAALDDRDIEVARFAAGALVALGEFTPVDAWCLRRADARGVPDQCATIATVRAEQATYAARLPGTYFRAGNEFRPAASVTIRSVDPADGTICIADACEALARIELTGSRLELAAGPGSSTGAAVLRFSGDSMSGVVTTAANEHGTWIDLTRLEGPNERVTK